MLNGLDLFSGIGGLAVALRDYVRPVAYCEIDTYCQAVLLSRMASGDISSADIWDDVRSFPTLDVRRPIDIIYGGFPCQDISVAGHGKGLAGERSGLYWEIHRLAKEIQPAFIFLENVPAILCRGGSAVVQSLTALGYDCRWCVISAASVGALHRRERWFLLAHSSGERRQQEYRGALSNESADERWPTQDNNESECGSKNVAYSRFFCERCLQKSTDARRESPSFHDPRCSKFWEAEPDVGRVVDGVPRRMERIKCLGNAVVPAQCKKAFEILAGIEK